MMKLLNDAMGKWRLLAVFLGVDASKFDEGVSCDDCMINMITQWIQLKGDDATIDAITEALASDVIGNKKLAKIIKESETIQKTYYGMNILNNCCINCCTNCCIFLQTPTGTD